MKYSIISIMNMLYLLIIMSSLMLSGCFSSPTNEEEKVKKMHILWEYSYDFDGGAPSVKPLIYENKIITSGDAKITALDYGTGEQIWKTPFDFHMQLMNDSFGVADNVIVGSIPDKILSWNIKTGNFLWEVEFTDSLSLGHFLGITGSSDFLIVASSGNYLYKISEKGNINIHNIGVRSYETSVYDDILYAGQRMGEAEIGIVSAYDLETMELIWRFEPSIFGYSTRMKPVLEDGIIYIGTSGGPAGYTNGFFALNAQTGEEIWRREDIWTYSAVLVGDKIFGVNGDGVWALSKKTGQILWKTKSQGGHSESILDYLDGYVYWAHGSGLHIFDAETGKLVHVMPSPDGSYLWQVTADKGRIFVQSNRTLYAFAPWGHTEPLEE